MGERQTEPLTSSDGKLNISSRLEKGLSLTHEALAPDPSDRSLLEQYQEQLMDYKRDFSAMYEDLLALEVDEEDEGLTVLSQLEKILFECSHQLKKLLDSHLFESMPTSSAESSGVKLPN